MHRAPNQPQEPPACAEKQPPESPVSPVSHERPGREPGRAAPRGPVAPGGPTPTLARACPYRAHACPDRARTCPCPACARSRPSPW
ncbi:hypothetical protein GCM10010349_00790 [Streptomyces flavofungini]|nr:hypothetical protein GCM10010349_00790 [Streptomyces flavofungini]